MSNFVDLRATLSNYGTDHVVRNEDLLSQGLTGHNSTNGGSRCRGTPCRSRLRTIRRGLVWTGTCICGVRSRSSSRSRPVVQGWLRNGGWCGLARHVSNTVSTCCSPVGVRVMSPEGVWVTVLATSRLRNVRHDLHATWNCSSRATAPGSVSGSCWSTETFSKLLDESHGNVIRGNVYGISNTENDKRPLGRQLKAGVRGVETGARRFLDLANADTSLANDGADENMGD